MPANSAQTGNNRVEREFEIRNTLGIHARPASLFVKVASRYDADVTVEKGDSKVSGKSIMGLMTLAVSCGARLKLTAVGDDAEEALEELGQLIESKFDEE
jgi:phosphocarrier protein HPr